MRKIFRFKETSSTQDRARELAAKKAPEGTIAVADIQTAGKGRLGREWLSPAGGLWFSLILYPEVSSEELPRITMVAAVAVAEAINRYCGTRLEIKWPNDIVSSTGDGEIIKVCGILTEADFIKRKAQYVIIGIGVNVNNTMKDVPAVSLKQLTGKNIPVDNLLKEILKQFDNYYHVFTDSGIGPIRDRCMELSAIIGKEISVDCGKRSIKGVAEEIKNDGSLIVKAGNKKERILAGDIKLLRY